MNMNLKDYEFYYKFIKDDNLMFSIFFDVKSKNNYIDTIMSIHCEVHNVLSGDSTSHRSELIRIKEKYEKIALIENNIIKGSEEIELSRNVKSHPNFQDPYKRYVNRLRVRKQRQQRVFKKSCNVIENLKKKIGNYKVFRIILLDETNLNTLNMVMLRNNFFSSLRKNKDMPKNSEYICFLSYNEVLGFYLDIFVFYKSSKDSINISNKMIDLWLCMFELNNDVSKTYALFMENQKNNRPFFSQGSPLEELEEELMYIIEGLSFKSLLYSYNFSDRIKTFVSGSLRTTQKSRKNVNQLGLGENMSTSVTLPNSLSIRIGSSPPPIGLHTRSYYDLWWEPRSMNNAFLLIIGQSGSGKTNMLRTICNQLIYQKIPVWVFDPHGSMSDLELEKIFLSSGTDSTIGVNPLRIYASDFKKKGVFDYVRSIQSMIKYAIPSMGSNQSAILKKVLEKVYEVYTHEPSVLPRNIKAPTLKNALDELNSILENSTKRNQESIRLLLNAIDDIFTHPVFTRESDINIFEIINKSVYFDISKLELKERFIIFETILRQMFEIFSESEPLKANEIRLVIMVDETRLLNINSGNSEAYHRMLNIIVNEGRKYGISLILASQSSEHFSRDTILNSASKILFKLSSKDINIFSEGNPMISDGLKKLRQNQALFLTGSSYYLCNIIPLHLIPPRGTKFGI